VPRVILGAAARSKSSKRADVRPAVLGYVPQVLDRPRAARTQVQGDPLGATEADALGVSQGRPARVAADSELAAALVRVRTQYSSGGRARRSSQAVTRRLTSGVLALREKRERHRIVLLSMQSSTVRGSGPRCRVRVEGGASCPSTSVSSGRIGTLSAPTVSWWARQAGSSVARTDGFHRSRWEAVRLWSPFRAALNAPIVLWGRI
jgi:hypothetical protein